MSENNAGIVHLRSAGATLYKRNANQHLHLCESKPNPKCIGQNDVVEAFGMGKCPKLVRLLLEQDEQVLLKTLQALTTVLKSPQDAVVCCDNHILDSLCQLLFHDNAEIQLLTALAFEILAEHSHVRAVMIEEGVTRKINKAFAKQDEKILLHLYNAMLKFSSIMGGAQEVSQNGFVQIALDKLKQDTSDEIRIRALQLLKACVNDGISGTVLRTVDLEGVEICTKHIYSKNKLVRVAVLQALGAMCFSERGRERVIAIGIIKKICTVLMDKEWTVCCASAGALMVIAIHDEGKREIFECGVVETFGHLLHKSKLGIQLNIVKLISVISSYPPARNALCTPQIKRALGAMSDDPNELLARSARVALQAVLWTP